MAQVRAHQPALADAAQRDPALFAQMLREMVRHRSAADAERERQIAALNDDPFDVEAQRRIEEMIRQEAVMENLNTAMEYHPESFGSVTMLYVDVEVNGHKVKAFVDSGAQATIMSPDCAEKCGIMRLVDKRFAGVAHGVGTAKILGRVHSAQVKVGSLFLQCSFTIMEGGAQGSAPQGPDMLLGLDNLRRHQACIDLRDNKLKIGDEAVPFLSEHEAPKQATAPGTDLPNVHGKDGAQMSQSGAVIKPPSTSSAGAFAGIGNVLGGGSSSTGQQSSSGRTAGASTATGSGTAGAASSSAGAAAGQGAGAGAGAGSADAAKKFGEAQIAQLQAMGFDRAECIQALDATDGDLELAAGLLL